MPISNVCYIDLLLYWLLIFLDPIHSAGSHNWLHWHLLNLLHTSHQLLILHISILPKLLFETASLAEADLHARKVVLRIPVLKEVDCNESEVDAVEP